MVRQKNSDSILYRPGGLTIGLDSPKYTGNKFHIAKHLIVRMAENGDMADFVNEHSNLEHGSDVIWGVLFGSQPNNPGLFHLTPKSGINPDTSKECFIVRYNGNVGIGMGDPLYKLDVAGTIHTNEVIIDQTNLPDYVFNEGYDLRSLEDLNQYIKKNKHLPEIPSARTTSSQGVKIGDFSNKLLKKVEELTLYTIQLNEEAANEKTELRKLQKDNELLRQQLKEIAAKIK